jgi:hypothetical protein
MGCAPSAALLSTWNERDMVLQLTSLPRIYDGANLNFMYFVSSTSQFTVSGVLNTGYE